MRDIVIPFNKPTYFELQKKYILDAFENRCQISGDGEYSKRCESILRDISGVKHALLTPSCTQALELCALLLDLKPEDEVIVPSFTFVSTANAFASRGAKIKFVDIREDTLNLDETKLAQAISSRTRAIVPVHYAGIGAQMDEILRLAQKHGIEIIEDNAHGLTSTFDDKPLGSFGSMSALSFHETKNFTCGEGGCWLTQDDELFARAETIRNKGTDRTRFFRGEVDKYTWKDKGSSFLMPDLLAAVLLSQLEQRGIIQSKRTEIWNRYHQELEDWANINGVRRPVVPKECRHNAHLYYLLLPTETERDRFIEQLQVKGISAIFHYQPLHASEMGRKLGCAQGDLPVSEDVSTRIVRLPFFFDFSSEQQSTVINTVKEFVC
ncbi:MAG: dTDP-4-amino-4,6-dideoxygalactose transaminase [Opitutae bacterium]|nr:dTDP-4-amino-4,6-dideoxygalactose transaminase [Opitutae bacterium]